MRQQSLVSLPHALQLVNLGMTHRRLLVKLEAVRQRRRRVQMAHQIRMILQSFPCWADQQSLIRHRAIISTLLLILPLLIRLVLSRHL